MSLVQSTTTFSAGITYLSGCVRPEALSKRPDFGVLFSPMMGNRPQGLGTFACDNGVYGEFNSGGRKPFSQARFEKLLASWQHLAPQALFGVAPDVIAPWQAELAGLEARHPWRATIERSLPVLPIIRSYGYPAAFVAQDNMELHPSYIPWDEFDVLFLGGGQHKKYLSETNRVRRPDGSWVGEWKLSPGARKLVDQAKARGKWVHMGRVNSFKRLSYAASIGCDSADGTCIGRHAKGPDFATAEVIGWLDRLNGQQLASLVGVGVAA